MGGDISDSAKLGVGILILCFLMGIIFNLFTLTRGVTTKSSNQLQSSFNTVADSAYATYDNTTVFGSQVLNAITTYATEKMCIVVGNKANYGVGSSYLGPTQYFISKPDGGSPCHYYGYALKGDPNRGSLALTYSSPYYITMVGLDLDESKKSMDTKYTRELGNEKTYINESDKYDSHLIKDKTGLVVGIVFELRGD